MSSQTDFITREKTSPREHICEQCLKIDFQKALAVPAAELRKEGERGILLDSNIERFRNFSVTGCQLCRVLSSTICENVEYWSDPRIQDQTEATPLCEYELRAHSYLIHCLWAPVTGGNQSLVEHQDYHVLACTPRTSWGWGMSYFRNQGPGDSGYVVCLPKDSNDKIGPYGPRIVLEEFDHQRARSWITDCVEHHGSECHGKLDPVPGMMLIDTDTLDIVLAQPHMKWACLSYVWGPQSSKQSTVHGPNTEMQRSMPRNLPSDVSTVIRDAIAVTKQMGIGHLWVDRYCINQDDAAEKASQIRMMDLIYHGAEFTIIAAAGEDENHGLPGVGSCKRTNADVLQLDSCKIITTAPDPVDHVIGKSRWWQRGWTFQEGLLSRRRLVFTESQVLFECNTTSCIEAAEGLEQPESHEVTADGLGKKIPTLFRHIVPGVGYLKPRSFYDPNPEEKTYVMCFKTLQAYTRRTLSFDSDSINGILGSLQFSKNIDPSLVAIGGLPYRIPGQSEDPQLVNKRLFVALCWFHSDHPDIRRRPDFPSWTWAGWAGPVRWMGMPSVGERGYRSYIRDVQLVLKNGWHSPTVQHSLNGTSINWTEDVVAFRFRAQLVPSSLFMFNIRKWYPGKTGMENEQRYYTSYSDQSTRTSSSDEDERGNTGEEGEEEETHGHIEDCSDTTSEVASDAGESNLHEPLSVVVDDAYNGDDEEIDTSARDTDSQCSSSGGHNDDNQAQEHGDASDTRGTAYMSDAEDEDSLIDDWNRWTVGKHRFYDKMAKLRYTPREFLSRLDDGSLGCLLLGDCHGNGGFTERRFMLVVEWKGQETAVRVGALVLNCHYYVDVQYRDFFDAEDLPWKSVELV